MKLDIATIEDYMSSFPKETQEKLETIRKLIKRNAPNSIESISYGMPAYKLNKKPLVYFGAFSKHIGFYATPNGNEKFKKKLSMYKKGKDSVQFPNHIPLPLELITEIVKFKVLEIYK